MQSFKIIDALIQSHQPDDLKKIIASKLIMKVVEDPLDLK